MLPGDTLFVPEQLDKTTFVQYAKDWTQILANLGLGASLEILGREFVGDQAGSELPADEPGHRLIGGERAVDDDRPQSLDRRFRQGGDGLRAAQAVAVGNEAGGVDVRALAGVGEGGFHIVDHAAALGVKGDDRYRVVARSVPFELSTLNVYAATTLRSADEVVRTLVIALWIAVPVFIALAPFVGLALLAASRLAPSPRRLAWAAWTLKSAAPRLAARLTSSLSPPALVWVR